VLNIVTNAVENSRIAVVKVQPLAVENLDANTHLVANAASAEKANLIADAAKSKY
jgi:hypothetical protein|tara:strand:- start:1121 stop:1285 length:165 start_codon:yes stop_codon:yes gene_type:complete